MRKVRVTASMKKEFAGLRDSRGNLRRGGVMRVPPILSCDEWEALASVQQEALIAASAEDRYKPEAVVTSQPESDPHRESERLYQQDKKDQIQVLKDFRDAGQRRVRTETMR